jgi:hypothetical protein
MFAEEWKFIQDYENYEVSNLGNVRNKKTGRILKSYDKGGYAVVGLSKTIGKIFQVHRLVCQAFILNPENKPQVNHIDKNGLNNNVKNLEWNTVVENNIHRSNGVTQTTNQNMIIYRVDKDTNEKLEKYDSIELAGEWAFKQGLVKNIHSGRTNISNMIRGVYKISCGFKWVLEEQLSLENEIWKQVVIKDKDTSNYYVSSLGRFKNSKGIIMKDYKPHHSGYIYVRVNNDKYALHRLIAFTFLENSENKEYVNHIDGNKTNNSLANIEWNTPRENSLHSHKTGLTKCFTRKITQYDLEMNKIKEFNSIVEASKILNIGKTNIKAVLYNNQKTAGGFIFKYLE